MVRHSHSPAKVKHLEHSKNISEGDGGKKDSPSLQTVYEGSVVRQEHRILNDQSHVLFPEFDLLPSGRRYRTFKCKTNPPKALVHNNVPS